MNHFIELYKKGLNGDLSYENRLKNYRVTTHMIALYGNIDDLKEFERYYTSEQEELRNEANQIA